MRLFGVCFYARQVNLVVHNCAHIKDKTMRLLSTFGVVGLIACSGDKPEPAANSAPIFTSVEITPSEGITTSTDLLCVATATDDDNDALELSYQWTDVDGTVLSETDSLTLSPENTTPTTEITCTATVSDGEVSVTEESSVTVENTAPTVSNVSITPETVLVNSLLECSFDAEDLDGEELTVSYVWTQNGTEVGTEASLQLDAENFTDDDVIVCTVTVEDGYEGTASDSAEVVIGNTAPVIGSTTITPENPYSYETLTCTANSEPTGITAAVTSSDMFYNDSTLTCAATASDIDPEDAVLTYTYAWSTGDIGADLVLTGSMMPGAEVTCTATATDGSGAAISVDAMETLMNRAPTVDSVTLPQDVTAETTSILCDATGSDLDGETPTLTYAWTVGGVAHSETSDTLTDTFVYSDTIECTVTSADAMETSSAMSATTTVLNTVPVVSNVVILLILIHLLR